MTFEIQNFLILFVVATSVIFLLWQLVKPWKKKNKEGCDKCGEDVEEPQPPAF